jgi:hypothetical protein
VAEGRSVLIGVFRDTRVVACVEVDPAGDVRQFLGPANRPPHPAVERVVIGALRDHGLVARPRTG